MAKLTDTIILGDLTVTGTTRFKNDVTMETEINSNFIPDVDGSYSLGTASLRFSTLYAQGIDVEGQITSIDTDTNNVFTLGNSTNASAVQITANGNTYELTVNGVLEYTIASSQHYIEDAPLYIRSPGLDAVGMVSYDDGANGTLILTRDSSTWNESVRITETEVQLYNQNKKTSWDGNNFQINGIAPAFVIHEDDADAGSDLFRLIKSGGNTYFQEEGGDILFSGYNNVDIPGNFQVKTGGVYNNIWHAGNDGAGSGLDADTLDSLDSTQFLRSDTNDTFTGNLDITGELGIGLSGSNAAVLHVEVPDATPLAKFERTGSNTGHVEIQCSGNNAYVNLVPQGGIETSLYTYGAGNIGLISDGNEIFTADANGYITLASNLAQSLGTTAGDTLDLFTVKGNDGNANNLDVKLDRVSSGSTWTSAKTLIQKRVDATDMGYLSFGTDTSNTGMGFGYGSAAEHTYFDSSGNWTFTRGLTLTYAAAQILIEPSTTNATTHFEIRDPDQIDARYIMKLWGDYDTNQYKALFVSSSGRVGIGADVDSGYTLNIGGDTSITGELIADSIGIGESGPANNLHISSSNPTIRLEDTDGASAYAQIQVDANGSIALKADPGATGASSSLIDLEVDGSWKVRVGPSGFSLATGGYVSSILDEDTMSSNSSSALATQQSIKAYVDAEVSGGTGNAGTLDGLNSLQFLRSDQSDTMDGQLTINLASGEELNLDAAPEQYVMTFRNTSNNRRWGVYIDTTETGSNIGYDYRFVAFEDDGSHLGDVYEVNRATQVLDFDQTPTVGGTDVSLVSAYFSEVTNGIQFGDTGSRASLISSSAGLELNHGDNSPIRIKSQGTSVLEYDVSATTWTATGQFDVNATVGQVATFTNTVGSGIVYSDGGSGYGAFYARGSGTNTSYLFLGNTTSGERGRVFATDNGWLYNRSVGTDLLIQVDNGTQVGRFTSAGLEVTGDVEASGVLRYSTDGTEINSDGLELAAGDKILHNGTQSRDKIRVWSSSSYSIGMENSYTYGYLNGYAMTFQMNTDADRGFWWGDVGDTNAQGAMSLTTDGRLYVDQLISVGGDIVWHAGNDGSGSGLDADLLDGQHGSYYAALSGADFTGGITSTDHIAAGYGDRGVALTNNDGYGNASVAFNHLAGTPEGDGNSGRIHVNTDSTSGAYMAFELLSNTTNGVAVSLTDVMTMYESGLRLHDNKVLKLGSGDDAELFFNASNTFLDLNVGNFYIRDGSTTRFTFDDNGDFDATGDITSNGSLVWHAGNLTPSNYLPLAGGTMTGRLDQSTSGIHAATKDDISTRTDSGFWETTTATTAEGWPDISGTVHMHMMSSTHYNGANYYSMQIAASFWNSDDVYFRVTNDVGTASWNKMWHQGNHGSGSGLDADLLEGQHGSYYLDPANFATGTYGGGLFVIPTPTGESITNTGNVNQLQIYQGTVGADAMMTFHVAGDVAVHFGLDGGTNDLAVGGWSFGAATHRIWHEGNDGAGSGLDADTLDGYQPNGTSSANTIALRDSSSDIHARLFRSTYNTQTSAASTADIAFRNDTSDNYVRFLDGSGFVTWLGNHDGAGSGLDADTLDGQHANDFGRYGTSGTWSADQTHSGDVLIADTAYLEFGVPIGSKICFTGSHTQWDLLSGNLYVRDNTTTRFTFARTTGTFTATGNVTAYSDETLKDIHGELNNSNIIDNLEVFNFSWKDGRGSSVGPTAQNVMRDLPEVVVENSDGILSLDYGKYAVAALYEEKKKRETLEEKVEKLEQLINRLLEEK